MNNQPIKSSSEELYIIDYLDKQGINYELEYKLNDLKGDDKAHRRVDFYLSNLGVYVEYFGLYNSTKSIRTEYDKKVKVYLKNRIPSIFLYPHELGFLDYAFHSKMLKLLRIEKFKSRKNLFRYKMNRYLKNGKGYLFFSIVFWFYLFYVFARYENGLENGLNALLTIICLVTLVYNTYKFIRNFLKYFWFEY